MNASASADRRAASWRIRIRKEGGGSLPDHLPQLPRDALLTSRQHWTLRVICVYPAQPPHPLR
jgi:hypothetical protein